MATVHIESNREDISDIVLMPGDPKRSEYIAKKFLKDYKLVNSVRGMTAYTGYYKDRLVTVFPSGMGNPSMGIYSYELFKLYGVEKIIRIGSAGAYDPNLKLFDVVVAKEAYSESSFAKTQGGETRDVIAGNEELNQQLIKIANDLNIPVHYARIHSSDVFYREGDSIVEHMYKDKECVCVEMESFALFHNANVLGKKAACVLTISDSLVTHEVTTSEQRQTAFNQMMQIALNLAE